MDDIKLVDGLDPEEQLLKAKCLGSLLFFTQIFFKLRTGREFRISEPIGRESHYITICRDLTSVFYGEFNRLLINIAPGHSKSELCKHFIAWAYAWYPDCNFLYVSHGIELASKHTHSVKQIMEMPLYRKLFGVEIRQDSSAKDEFTTTRGGVVSGWGAKGGITGYDAGLPGVDRFSGALILDDLHKPDEVHSDGIRQSVKDNYLQTLERRLRSPDVPVICIGQRLHEDDLPGNLLGTEATGYVGYDGRKWHRLVLKSIDEAGNILDPYLTPREMLINLEDKTPYVYASQYQQNPQPAGGGIFKRDRFVLLEDEPDILGTIITIDSAETDKNYNDATVFSFFGVYRIENKGIISDLYGLHWIDCRELRVRPHQLEGELIQFFAECSRHPVPPKLIAIEKKSTGVTLADAIGELRGVNVIPIDRTAASGSKTTRFLGIEAYVSGRQVSLPINGHHTKMCLDHMEKITANNTHAHDDIADTLEMGVTLGLRNGVVVARYGDKPKQTNVAKKIMGNFAKTLRLKKIRVL